MDLKMTFLTGPVRTFCNETTIAPSFLCKFAENQAIQVLKYYTCKNSANDKENASRYW